MSSFGCHSLSVQLFQNNNTNIKITNEIEI